MSWECRSGWKKLVHIHFHGDLHGNTPNRRQTVTEAQY
jgi:hypothetical protein